jgi:hypothetical protein
MCSWSFESADCAVEIVMVVPVAVAPVDAIGDNLLGCQASGRERLCKPLGAQRFYS